MRAIFNIENENSSSPYTLTKSTAVRITKALKMVIHIALLIVAQNSTRTAAATTIKTYK
jgi:hypothetical protein